MDSVKLAASLLAVAFLIAAAVELNLRESLGESVQQILSVRQSLKNLSLKTVSETASNITFSLQNPYNLTIYVYSVTGPYVSLERPSVIPPLQNGTFTLKITNFSAFESLAKSREENITLLIGLAQFNFTVEVNL